MVTPPRAVALAVWVVVLIAVALVAHWFGAYELAVVGTIALAGVPVILALLIVATTGTVRARRAARTPPPPAEEEPPGVPADSDLDEEPEWSSEPAEGPQEATGPPEDAEGAPEPERDRAAG